MRRSLDGDALRLGDGKPYPLGATWDGSGTNFAVFSEHGTRALLCVFDEQGHETLYSLPRRTNSVWHGYLQGCQPGTAYGFRMEGPYAPHEGHRFNSSKLLIDPYARLLTGQVDWEDGVYGYRRSPVPDDAIPDLNDSADSVPKSIVIDPSFDWEDDRPPETPLADTVIYETHVKGFTFRHPEVPPDLRGRYLGLAEPAATRHLQQLGVTSVELLPVHAFIDDNFLESQGLRNYWGYNTLGFFAPEQRYSQEGSPPSAVTDFKEMVKRLHRAGLEVLLDVVYNHTAEGDALGPTLSFRGLDNRAYYRLPSGDLARYEDTTGTGNALNLHHPMVLRLVLDSLRYWVQEMHVDGFRFDLATSLGRGPRGFDPSGSFFAAVRQDPVLARVKLIAEPWDLAPGGYQVGHFPVGWSEWNDKFRDTMRAFWLGHPARLGEFALRLTGSADLYSPQRRGPLASLNYVTAHDGFTLNDLVTYTQKYNRINGEDNRDGSDHNLSANFGIEGPTLNESILAERARRARSLVASVMLSQGVPMLLGGDELLRTQWGNNNPYCQDNEISWYSWPDEPEHTAMERFIARLAEFRRQRPALRSAEYHPEVSPMPQLQWQSSWFDANGESMTPHEWNRDSPRTLQIVIAHNGKAGSTRGPEPPVLIQVNAERQAIDFSTPRIPDHRAWQWRVVLDSSRPELAASWLKPLSKTVVPDGSIVVAQADAPPRKGVR